MNKKKLFDVLALLMHGKKRKYIDYRSKSVKAYALFLNSATLDYSHTEFVVKMCKKMNILIYSKTFFEPM